mmetsp:Transcript_18380/g.31415  ORF Transcript_18380/g.31415 Transcript_18380/m.31415 type:complete len:156 (-) Transcript_18380:56-523(-)
MFLIKQTTKNMNSQFLNLLEGSGIFNEQDFSQGRNLVFFDVEMGDTFNQKDCVICMDLFRDMESIVRIPSCLHIFHPQCCKKWFESRIQENNAIHNMGERKCPHCNSKLLVEELRVLKQLREEEDARVRQSTRQMNRGNSNASSQSGSKLMSREK